MSANEPTDQAPSASREADAAVAPGGADVAPDSAAQPERRRRIAALKQELLGGDLYTAAEVAEVLDIHPRTVAEYIRDGRLQAFQIGGGFKVSEGALRAFVREQTQPLAPPAESGVAGAVKRALQEILSTPAAARSNVDQTKGRKGKVKCSFCGKGRDQVERLIAGPGMVFICNACVRLCDEILAEHQGDAPAGE